MFSEYASKFLAQSQTRMSAIRDGRLAPAPHPAPLFHSAADFLPEDPEHEQEVQDFYALRSSRRHFGAYASSLSANDDAGDSEDDEDSTHSLHRSKGKGRAHAFGGSDRIRSSWRARTTDSARMRSSSRESVFSNGTERARRPSGESDDSQDRDKDKMVEIGLDDSEALGMVPDDIDHSDMVEAPDRPFLGYGSRRDSDMDDDHPPEDITIEMPSSPPPFQQFKKPPREPSPSVLAFPRDDKGDGGFMPKQSSPAERGPQMSTIPQQVYHPPIEPPTHDHVWGTVYIFFMACMFATSFVVWLHTEAPTISPGDTIYSILHGSMHLLAIDTVVALVVAVVWMYLLRSFVRPIVYLLIVSVPVALTALSIYPLVNSFKSVSGDGAQAGAMRWGSLVPALIACSWVYMAWKSRHALTRAVGVIQLSTRILAENPALFVLSFGTLAAVCVITWTWVGMFTRVFLTGNTLLHGAWTWSLQPRTVLLGIFYIAMYLWTLGVLSGVHRATSAATVSQWYFYRRAIPAPSSRAVMTAALAHATSTLFGSICLAALVSLLVRLPLLLAPRRIAGIIHLFAFNFIASPIAALVHPLTLSYAAIHSVPLRSSARQVARLRVVDTAGFGPGQHPRTAYRFARMVLTAARGVAALALGLGAWVAAAKGSGYGYVVGGIAGSIGYAVLGATEGCLSNIVDAALVCNGSESEGTCHCREAQLVFGG